MPQAIQSPKRFRVSIEGGGVAEEMHCLQLNNAAGGNRGDLAVIEFQKTKLDAELLETTALIDEITDKWCKVYQVESGDDILVHYGRFAGGGFEISPRTHRVVAVSRVDDYWISKAVDNAPYRDKLGAGAEATTTVNLPWVMNPYIDGFVFGNQYASPTVFNFVHGDSRGVASQEFTLQTAVQFLFANLRQGPLQDVVLADLSEIEAYPLRNVQFETGMFLPQCLDRLLKPYGYDWKIVPTEAPSDGLKFYVWKRTTGLGQLTVNLAAITDNSSSTGDPTDSDADQISIESDLADQVANIVIVQGDPIRVEGTFQLVPAWDPNDETTDLHALSNSGDEGINRVFRDYVLNETGEYDGQPTFDAGAFFGTTQTHRRRRFYPCLTLGPDNKPIGRSHGYELEFFNGHEYIPFDKEPFKVLLGECGIRLTSTQLRASSMRQLQLRITATVESDHVLEHSTGFDNTTPLNNTKPMVIKTSGRYRRQYLQDSGSYQSKYHGGAFANQAIDDTAAIQSAAENFKARFNKASMRGTITLSDQTYNGPDKLGKRVELISGRNISLAAAPAATDRFPVITGYSIDVQQQTTTLFLDNAAE